MVTGPGSSKGAGAGSDNQQGLACIMAWAHAWAMGGAALSGLFYSHVRALVFGFMSVFIFYTAAACVLPNFELSSRDGDTIQISRSISRVLISVFRF